MSRAEPTVPQQNPLLSRLEELNAIGIALSSERDINRLLETILLAAMRITNADAGTLYLLDPDKQELTFEIMRTNSLGNALGGTTGQPIPASVFPIHLYKEGRPNHSMVVAHAALSGASVNIPDAYKAEGFDFSGTKGFDNKSGYRSTSFLAVPMRNHENEVIGVVQLINALDRSSGAIVAFSRQEQSLLESLSSQAAIALTNRRLIQQMEDLFESFIGLINTAIDDKSAYTGGHCERVPVLTMMLADAVSRTKLGPLKDFVMTEKDRYELKIAGLLHDCGKITTPVHVVDKSTKLETIFDRIQLIDTRFEVLKRDAEISMLRAQLTFLSSPLSLPSPSAALLGSAPLAALSPLAGEGKRAGGSERDAAILAEYDVRIRQLDEDREFLRHCNIGAEKMPALDQQRVQRIAAYAWRNAAGEEAGFLSADELENLTIRSGTLTEAERQIINRHIDVTIKMLESLPWPRHLRKVPEYAGGHHERMDGNGYPRGLRREEMSVQARVMGIADIFEALTAKDRPYKRGKTLTESLTILGKFKESGHIDPDLFDVFVREKVYLEYAKQFLDPDQIDAVDESGIPGYTQSAV
jgi:HD-GYP domain-containing protein (c-di-GMP phosphodiesterase class II)